MITAQAFSSIQAIERDVWNDCFPDALEDWDYIMAVENSGIEGFEWRYLTLFEGSTLIAAATAFTTRYRLDTTVQGLSKRFTEQLNRALPGLMQLRFTPSARRSQNSATRALPATFQPQSAQRCSLNCWLWRTVTRPNWASV